MSDRKNKATPSIARSGPERFAKDLGGHASRISDRKNKAIKALQTKKFLCVECVRIRRRSPAKSLQGAIPLATRTTSRWRSRIPEIAKTNPLRASRGVVLSVLAKDLKGYGPWNARSQKQTHSPECLHAKIEETKPFCRPGEWNTKRLISLRDTALQRRAPRAKSNPVTSLSVADASR